MSLLSFHLYLGWQMLEGDLERVESEVTSPVSTPLHTALTVAVRQGSVGRWGNSIPITVNTEVPPHVHREVPAYADQHTFTLPSLSL